MKYSYDEKIPLTQLKKYQNITENLNCSSTKAYSKIK